MIINTRNRMTFDTLPTEHWLRPNLALPLTESHIGKELPDGSKYITLEMLRDDINAKINEARLQANQTSFTYDGKAISCDTLSRGDIDAVNGIVAITNALPPGWVGGWKALDNTIIPIPDVATWIAFYGAMVAQGTANFVKAQTLKAQLNVAYLAQDVEAMYAVEW